MMKKLFIIILAIVSLSCGSKHKAIQESRTEVNTKQDSLGVSVQVTKVDSTAESSEDEWVWQPQDSTCQEPVEITKPDGTKIKIPKKGVLTHRKRSNHINILNIKKDSASVKKTTSSDTYNFKREKNVTREPGFNWWPFWVLAILGGYLLWKNRK